MNATFPDSSKDVADSLERLKAALPPNISFIILGNFAISFSILTIVCIAKSKSLRTKCFALIAANASVDLLLGISYSAIAYTRLYRYYTGIGEVITMWRCCWEASLISFAQMISLSMSATLVIDRLTATLLPHRYKQWSYKRTTLPLIFAAILYGLAQLCVHFVDSWNGKNRIVVTCGIEDTITPDHFFVLVMIQIFTSFVVVLGNCVLAFTVRKRRNRIAVTQTRSVTVMHQLEKEKKDLTTFKTITAIILAHILTHTGGRLALFVVTALSDDTKLGSLTSRYTRMLVVANAAIHFLVLFSTSAQFRAAVKSMFCTKAVNHGSNTGNTR